jgi:cytochrome bd-type quinol oxidase subunit 1
MLVAVALTCCFALEGPQAGLWVAGPTTQDVGLIIRSYQPAVAVWSCTASAALSFQVLMLGWIVGVRARQPDVVASIQRAPRVLLPTSGTETGLLRLRRC